ncbi:MAG: phage tail protein [Alphaproteobacteria bacterium]|nr:phage tail protein [Alphaproteobacteria bacterium]
MVANVVLKAGLMAAQIGLGMLNKIEGPRLDSRKFAGGQYDVLLPRVWGTAWVAGQFIWGKDLIEVKRRRKTKGGKYNDYSYFADFDVVLACHEIGAVRRIKLDGHLVYDMSNAGPVTPFDFGSAGGTIADYIRIYLGDDGQDVDDVMRADIEAKHGEGATPAYRGYGRIRFHNLPLEKFGNRVPQVEAEIVSIPASLHPFSELAIGAAVSHLTFSPDYSTLSNSNIYYFAIIDTAARAVMLNGGFSILPREIFAGHGYFSDGTLVYGSQISNAIAQPVSGAGSILAATPGTSWGTGSSALDGNGIDHWCVSTIEATYVDGVEIVGIGGESLIFTTADGDVWVVGYASSTSALFRQIGAAGATRTVTGLPAMPVLGSGVAAFHYVDAASDHFVLAWGGALYRIDRATGANLGSYTPNYPAGLTREAIKSVAPGAATFWVGFEEIASADLGSIRQLALSSWYGTGTHERTIYDPINHALIIKTSSTLRWCYLDRIGESAVTLATIVRDVFELGGGDPARLDVTALTHPIRGYSASGGSGKDWVDPLLELYDIDARPHGFLLEFVPRGGAAGAEISSGQFVLEGDGGSGGAPLFASTGAGGTDVPSQVVLKFADADADGQPNAAASPRLAELDGQRKLTIDMGTLVLDKDEAQQLVTRFHRRRLFDARRQTFPLPAAQVALEPADVHPVSLRGFPLTGRLRSMEMGADRQIRTEWVRDDAAVALLNDAEGAGFDGRSPSVISYPLLSRGFFRDLPYLSDSDARTPPSIYVGAAPYTDGTWPGAVAFQAVDGEYSNEIASIEASQALTWGIALDALPDRDPWLWDRISSITVRLNTGTLSGCTEAEIDADPTRNQALFGDEIVNFTTATLVAAQTWEVSGFKRGRRGTEWACAGHVAGEDFQLLDNVEAVALGLDEVGTNQSFKAITSGRTTAFPVPMTPFTGASLKPWAPCHLAGASDSGSGDWALSWVRRTRVGGAWTSGTAIPLSEASEAYEVDIMDGATVVRTITGLTAPACTYDAAAQTADFGAPQASLTFRVYQISDAVGRGFAAQSTV